MLNTESIDAFWKTLPSITPGISELLYLTARPSDENGIATLKLTYRGYLGCVAFAGAGNDEIILRLLPKRHLTKSPIAIAWNFATEGMTIAPDLERFVAGRLAQLDIANPNNRLDQVIQSHLIQCAAHFGNTDSIEAVLQTLDEARLIEDAFSRRSTLWHAACPDDPLCEAIVAAWSLRGKSANHWACQAIHRIPEISIAWRIYLSSQLRETENVDLAEAAWRLILDDDVFDSTYTGYTRGTATADWENEPLVQAVHWLNSQPKLEIPRYVPTDLWLAAQTYAEDPLGYDGSNHLTVARRIARDDPILAYTHTANAAAFCFRSTQQQPTEAITFAYELAVENNWRFLCEVLEIAQSYLDLDLEDL